MTKFKDEQERDHYEQLRAVMPDRDANTPAGMEVQVAPSMFAGADREWLVKLVGEQTATAIVLAVGDRPGAFNLKWSFTPEQAAQCVEGSGSDEPNAKPVGIDRERRLDAGTDLLNRIIALERDAKLHHGGLEIDGIVIEAADRPE